MDASKAGTNFGVRSLLDKAVLATLFASDRQTGTWLGAGHFLQHHPGGEHTLSAHAWAETLEVRATGAFRKSYRGLEIGFTREK